MPLLFRSSFPFTMALISSCSLFTGITGCVEACCGTTCSGGLDDGADNEMGVETDAFFVTWNIKIYFLFLTITSVINSARVTVL